jgi:hypothetical protein
MRKTSSFRDNMAALPDGQRLTEAVAFARRTHVDTVDNDAQPGAAHGVSGNREDALDERHAARQITALGEEFGDRLRCRGNDEVTDGELTPPWRPRSGSR